LRVLSDGHFYRVGGHQPLKANVRVIAATHQNLEHRVREGLFREDLYHRLNVIRLRLPSLRERREDIPILAKHFLAQSAKQLGVEVKRMSEGAMQFLTNLELPGNVRQLENLCNWITVMAPGQTVEAKDLPQELTEGQGFVAPAASTLSTPVSQTVETGYAVPESDVGNFSNGHQAISSPTTTQAESSTWGTLLETEAAALLAAGQPEVMDMLGRQFESILIKTALKHTHGRKNDAAVRLGIGRNTITRKIHELGIAGAKDD
jgi:two-component system nitrogen regulation response regulator GlnG